MIRVNDDYKIKGYSRGFKVYKDLHRVNKEGEVSVHFLGYASSIEHALNMIQRQQEIDTVMNNDMTLGEAIEKMREIHEELVGLIPEIKEKQHSKDKSEQYENNEGDTYSDEFDKMVEDNEEILTRENGYYGGERKDERV